MTTGVETELEDGQETQGGGPEKHLAERTRMWHPTTAVKRYPPTLSAFFKEIVDNLKQVAREDPMPHGKVDWLSLAAMSSRKVEDFNEACRIYVKVYGENSADSPLDEEMIKNQVYSLTLLFRAGVDCGEAVRAYGFLWTKMGLYQRVGKIRLYHRLISDMLKKVGPARLGLNSF